MNIPLPISSLLTGRSPRHGIGGPRQRWTLIPAGAAAEDEAGTQT